MASTDGGHSADRGGVACYNAAEPGGDSVDDCDSGDNFGNGHRYDR